eukprot:gene1718-487_t
MNQAPRSNYLRLKEPSYCLSVDSQQKKFVVTTENFLKIYTMENWTHCTSLKQENTKNIVAKWSPHNFNKNHILSSQDKSTNLWNVQREEIESTFEGHNLEIKDLSWNPCNFNVFASAGEDYLINIWDLRQENPGGKSFKWNPLETVYFASSTDENLFIFDLRKDDYIYLSPHEIKNYDWNPQINSELAILSFENKIEIFDFDQTNKIKNSIQLEKNHNLLKYTLNGDSILLSKTEIDVLDSSNLNLLHSFTNEVQEYETVISDIIYLEFVNKNQLLSITKDGVINSYTLQIQNQYDDEDEDDEDEIVQEFTTLKSEKGFNVILEPKDDIVPVPPTSGGIIGFNGQLIYFSSFGAKNIYENNTPRLYKELLEALASSSPAIEIEDFEYFSNFFLGEPEIEEKIDDISFIETNQIQTNSVIFSYDIKKLYACSREIAKKLALNPKENITLYQSEGYFKSSEKWKIIDILLKTPKESWEKNPFFSDTLTSIINHSIKKRDIQTLAVISCLFINLEEKRNEQFKKFRKSYCDLLDRWSLIEKKNEILKFSSPDKKQEMDLCLNVQKCSICRLLVRGLSIQCFICGHGGHINHLQHWFKKNQQCASGCGCICIFE